MRKITVSYSSVTQKPAPSTAPSATTERDDSPSGDRQGDTQDATPILYIGSPSLGLTNLLLTHSAAPVRTCLCTL